MIRLNLILLTLLATLSVQAHDGDHLGDYLNDPSNPPTLQEGEIGTILKDYPNQGRSETVTTLIESKTGRVFELKIKGKHPELKAGTKIRIRGRALKGGVLAADGATLNVVSQPTAGALAAVTGNRTTLAIAIDFNNGTVGCSNDQINSAVLSNTNSGSMNMFMQKTSRGQVSFSGEVVRVKLNQDIAGSCDYNAWATAAKTAASSMGINTNNYQHRIFVLPSNTPCGWAGLGYLNGAETWVKQCDSAYIYAHEIGHNIGLHHAMYNGSEYGDASDTMGNSYREFNAPHMAQLGWIQRVTSVGIGQHQVAALSTLSTETQLAQTLKLPKANTADNYFISLRVPQGQFDSSLGAEFANRVSLHTHNGGVTQTNLIGTLGIGEVYTDSINGVSIRVDSIGAQSASVSITGDCTTVAPTITLNTSQLAGRAGQSVQVQGTIKNTNSIYCEPRDFTIAANMQSPLTASVTPSLVRLASQTTASFTATVQVPAGVASATYTGQTEVTETSSIKNATANFSVIVDETAPDAPTGLTASSQRKGKVQLTWTASGSADVQSYQVLRNNVVVGTSTSTQYIDSAVPSGTHVYSVKAVDRAGNVSAASATASITLQSPGGRKN